MNNLELLLYRIIRREVIQGDHKHKIEKMFSLIVDAARDEFTEDNKLTLDCFLSECFKNSLK
jgi:hypothetical protein